MVNTLFEKLIWKMLNKKEKRKMKIKIKHQLLGWM